MYLSAKCLTFINNAPHIYIAYSGGLDSHVLLHYCAINLKNISKITAVYVHHGLQSLANDWATHCQKQAKLLNINYKVLYVNVQSKQKSPEEAARDARYQAFKNLLHKEDVLLVGQHREDQLETVLLQLFRGAGLQGLSAMPEYIAFGSGYLIRPFLECSQQSLKKYALKKSLQWIEDPSNQCDDFRRNFLRNQIIPQLKTQWNALDKTVARSAKHCAKAQSVLSQLATTLLHSLLNKNNSLNIPKLLRLDENQQALVIRQWFKHLNLPMPSLAFMQQLQDHVIIAKKEASPLLKTHRGDIRRYQNHLYYVVSNTDIFKPQMWPHTQSSLPLSKVSQLIKIQTMAGISQTHWDNACISIRYRTGGEKIKLPHRKGQHTLKKLFQEASIPSWERPKIPLIYCDDCLIAIADLWISSEVINDKNGQYYQLKWQR